MSPNSDSRPLIMRPRRRSSASRRVRTGRTSSDTSGEATVAAVYVQSANPSTTHRCQTSTRIPWWRSTAGSDSAWFRSQPGAFPNTFKGNETRTKDTADASPRGQNGQAVPGTVKWRDQAIQCLSTRNRLRRLRWPWFDFSGPAKGENSEALRSDVWRCLGASVGY